MLSDTEIVLLVLTVLLVVLALVLGITWCTRGKAPSEDAPGVRLLRKKLPHRFSEVQESEARTLLESEDPVVVFVYSERCGWCKKMKPVLEAVEKEFEHINFVKVNAAGARDFCTANKLRAFPAMMTNFGDDNKVIGYRDADAVRKLLKKV